MGLLLQIVKKKEVIEELAELPRFSGKHRQLKTLNKQLGNLKKRLKYKQQSISNNKVFQTTGDENGPKK